MGHVNITTPLSGRFVVIGLGLAMINLHAKFEVSMFTHYEDIKSDQKCKNWMVCGVRGHPRS